MVSQEYPQTPWRIFQPKEQPSTPHAVAFEAFSFRVFSSLSSTLKPWSCRAMAFRKANDLFLKGQPEREEIGCFPQKK